jgi:hypothetical protein
MAGDLQASQQAVAVSAAATAQAGQELFQSAQAWPLVLEDRFETVAAGWPVGTADDPLASIGWTIADGRYEWVAEANDSFVWWGLPEGDSLADFYLSVRVRQASGPPNAEHGLVFRLDSELNQYYLFEVNGQGQYALFIQQADTWEALIDWQESDAVLVEGTNHLAVIVQADRFRLFVNEVLVAGYRDDRLVAGRAGLLIGLPEGGEQGAWEFDDFELRAP